MRTGIQNVCFNITTELPDSHASQNLSNQCDDVLLQWDLEKLHVMVTTDIAANICSAMTLTGATHLRSLAHTLILAAVKCLHIAVMSHLSGTVRNIVSYLDESNLAAAGTSHSRA